MVGVDRGANSYLFKLVDTKDTPSVLSMGACFFPIACAISRVTIGGLNIET